MHTVTVPLKRSFEHDGRYVAAGEFIQVSPVEALALARRDIVSLDPLYRHRVMVAAPIPEPEPVKPKRRRAKVSDESKPKRRYRRRDLTAEV